MQKTFNQLQLQHLHFNALGLKPLPSPLSHKQQNKKGAGVGGKGRIINRKIIQERSPHVLSCPVHIKCLPAPPETEDPSESPSQSTKSAQSVTDIQPDHGDTQAHPKHTNVQYSGLVCLLLSTCTHWCISCVCLSHTSVPTATDRWIPAHTAAVQCVGPLLAAPHGCFCCFMLSCAACSWGLIL